MESEQSWLLLMDINDISESNILRVGLNKHEETNKRINKATKKIDKFLKSY